MPRRNRPGKGRDQQEMFDGAALRSGWRRTETRRGAVWNVQPVSAEAAVKQYVCPSCDRPIPPGTAHLVAWRADAILGDQAALEDRRHWHEHCWRTGI